ncbi:MAG: rod shape-determining protein MreC [Geminicoccaceae bacterium]|nr:rod shape-determining protein MreC [Geminicoccaceae bacterium]
MKLEQGVLKHLAMPLKAFADRFAFGALIASSIALLIIGKANYGLFSMINTRVSDVLAPVMAVLREPVEASHRFAQSLGEIAVVHEENVRLREQNRQLLQWQAHAQRLASENRILRRALEMEVDAPAALSVGARVVADTGGPFVHTVLIDAGRRQGVSVGMAAIDELGLVGRVIEVGRNSSRLLLLTDFNSKIPAMVEPSRDQALLAGDNSREPGLVFLPLNPRVSVGDRVVTSGRGGLLPPGLPIGVVRAIDEDKIAVRTWVDMDRLDHLRLLEYAPVLPPERLEELQREIYGPPPPPAAREVDPLDGFAVPLPAREASTSAAPRGAGR